jgi:hypothetical protein
MKSADVENWLRRNCFALGNGYPFLFIINHGEWSFGLKLILGELEDSVMPCMRPSPQ